MTDLSTLAQQEIQEGRAVLLETALKHILETVEEVVSCTIEEAQTLDVAENSSPISEAMVHFHCRLHNPISIPLAGFCSMPGIVNTEMVNSMILLLRTHTGETITFKR